MRGLRNNSWVISEGQAVALLYLFLENLPFYHTGLKPVLLPLFTPRQLAAAGHSGDCMSCGASRAPACPFSYSYR